MRGDVRISPWHCVLTDWLHVEMGKVVMMLCRYPWSRPQFFSDQVILNVCCEHSPSPALQLSQCWNWKRFSSLNYQDVPLFFKQLHQILGDLQVHGGRVLHPRKCVLHPRLNSVPSHKARPEWAVCLVTIFGRMRTLLLYGSVYKAQYRKRGVSTILYTCTRCPAFNFPTTGATSRVAETCTTAAGWSPASGRGITLMLLQIALQKSNLF